MRYFDTILGTKPARRIKAFERKTVGVDAFVTSETGRVVFVFLDLLFERGCLVRFRFNRLNTFRWGRQCVSGNVLGNPRSSQNGRGLKPIRGNLEDAAHSEQPTARTIRWQHDLSHPLTNDPVDPVMLRQPLVQHRKIGIDQFGNRQVLLNEVKQEILGFLREVVIQQVVVLWIEF